MKSLAFTLAALTACTYDGSVGSTRLPNPPEPGHFAPHWVMPIGGMEQEHASTVAIAGNGNVIVAGSSAGAPDFTAPPAQLPTAERTQPPANEDSGFVAVRSVVDGSHIWGATIVGPASVYIESVAGDADGNVYVAGVRSLDGFEAGTPFVAAYGVTGALRWERSLGPGSHTSVMRLVATDDGPIISGAFAGTSTIGSVTATATGGRDGFVVAFDADGGERWHYLPADPGDDVLVSIVALHADGGVAVIGAVAGSMSVNRIDGTGALVWAQPIAPLHMYGGVMDIAQDASSHLVLTGQEGEAGQASLSVRILDLDGTLLQVGEVARGGFAATVLDNGMVVAADHDAAAWTAKLTAFDATGVLGDGAIAPVNLHAPGQVPAGAMIRALGSDGVHVAAAGEFGWAIDVGGQTWWPHDSGPTTNPNTYVTGGRDALVVLYDWVND